jgi:polyisoprenoid-binding protein YceI
MRVKKIVLLLVFVALATNIPAQIYFTKTGTISFDATAPSSPEKINAINNSAVTVLNTSTGELQFSVQMKGFIFERALMQEHFNDNYVESSKYPKGEFKGKVTNNAAIQYTKDGSYIAEVEGTLTIHGVTKNIKSTGTILVKGGTITTAANFKVTVKEYNISIPGLVADKVSKEPSIMVNCKLNPLKK